MVSKLEFCKESYAYFPTGVWAEKNYGWDDLLKVKKLCTTTIFTKF